MTNILPFFRRIKETTKQSGSNEMSLLIMLKRLVRSGEKLVQVSEFKLADQVLTHAIVASDVAFDLVKRNGSYGDVHSSLSSMTAERYGLTFQVAEDVSQNDTELDASILLKNWSREELIQYVLDHEVPVNPADIAQDLNFKMVS